MNAVSSIPLTEDDLAQLDALLESAGPQPMSLEEVDGFFCALHCAPDLIMPSEWLPVVCDGEPSFESEADASRLVDLLMRHWNAGLHQLTRTLDDVAAFMPVLAEDEDDIAHGNEWADGFMRGIDMRPESWASVLMNAKHARWLEPVLILHHEDDPDPKLRSTIESPEEREALLDEMIVCVGELYRFFEPQRRSRANGAAQTPERRAQPKIGRNDPCPCGSGKKYKQCCGKAG